MRFKEGAPSQMVRWYFADPEAEVFPGPTVFRSANWESTPYENDGLGEIRPSNRPWRNGARPNGFSGRSVSCLFPDSYWQSGIPEEVNFVLVKDQNNVPLCCVSNPFALLLGGDCSVTRRGPGAPVGALFLFGDASRDFHVLPGGILLAGDAEVHFHPPAGIVTPCCPGGTPALVTVDLVPPLFGAATGNAAWDAGNSWWQTIIPTTTPNLDVLVRWQCLGGGIDCSSFQLRLQLLFFGIPINTEDRLPDPGCVCAPLNMVYTSVTFAPTVTTVH